MSLIDIVNAFKYWNILVGLKQMGRIESIFWCLNTWKAFKTRDACLLDKVTSEMSTRSMCLIIEYFLRTISLGDLNA